MDTASINISSKWSNALTDSFKNTPSKFTLFKTRLTSSCAPPCRRSRASSTTDKSSTPTLPHHRRHRLSPRRVPQRLGKEAVRVQQDGNEGGGNVAIGRKRHDLLRPNGNRDSQEQEETEAHQPHPAVGSMTHVRPTKKVLHLKRFFLFNNSYRIGPNNHSPLLPYASSTIFLKKLARAAPSPVLRSTVSPLRILPSSRAL